MQTQGREKGVGVLCLSYNQQRFKNDSHLLCFLKGMPVGREASCEILADELWAEEAAKIGSKAGRDGLAICCSFLCLCFSDRQGGLSQASEWQTKWLESSRSARMRTYTLLRAYGSEGFRCNNITCLIPRHAKSCLGFIFVSVIHFGKKQLMFTHSPWLQRIIMGKSRQLVTTHL